MSKSWKVVLSFACIFLAGVVAGGFTSLRFQKSFVENRVRSEQFAFVQMKRLTEALSLTEEQVEKIKPVVETTGDELKRLRRDTAAAFQRMEAGILRELTGDQQVTFEEMQRRFRERVRTSGSSSRDHERSAHDKHRSDSTEAGTVSPPERH